MLVRAELGGAYSLALACGADAVDAFISSNETLNPT
jgi:hypothetical protein